MDLMICDSKMWCKCHVLRFGVDVIISILSTMECNLLSFTIDVNSCCNLFFSHYFSELCYVRITLLYQCIDIIQKYSETILMVRLHFQ